MHESLRTDGTTVTRFTCTETAKLIREALKPKFPGVKFSVRSHKYAGGASIDIDWTDGPLASEVDEVVKHYAGASFDGMIDLKSYHDTLMSFEGEDLPRVVHFGADYVFTHRSLSADLLGKARAYAVEHQMSTEGIDCGSGYWKDDPNHSGLVSVHEHCGPLRYSLDEAARYVARHMTAAGEVVKP